MGNLPKDVPIPEGELREAFSRFGELADVWVAKRPAGFGFVQFVDQRDAEDAVKETDGVNGWKVEVSSSRGPRGPGGGFGGPPRGGPPGTQCCSADVVPPTLLATLLLVT